MAGPDHLIRGSMNSSVGPFISMIRSEFAGKWLKTDRTTRRALAGLGHANLMAEKIWTMPAGG